MKQYTLTLEKVLKRVEPLKIQANTEAEAIEGVLNIIQKQTGTEKVGDKMLQKELTDEFGYVFTQYQVLRVEEVG